MQLLMSVLGTTALLASGVRFTPLHSAPGSISISRYRPPLGCAAQAVARALTNADAAAAEPTSVAASGQPVRLAFSEVASGASLIGGDRAPLVILHGLFGASGNFQSWASQLSTELRAAQKPRRILLVDLRNHGDSGHGPDMSWPTMASDVDALLQKEAIPRAVVMGHSLGGKVAMALALTKPERVERLGVLDMAPVSYTSDDGSKWGDIRAVVVAVQTVELARILSKRDADAVLSRSVADPGLRAFVLMNLVRTSTGGFRWRFNLEAIAASLPKLARWEPIGGQQYGGNTLFVGGGKSKYVRSSHLEAISSHFSRFSISTVRNAAHWVHADEPEALSLIVQSFLDAPNVLPPSHNRIE